MKFVALYVINSIKPRNTMVSGA